MSGPWAPSPSTRSGPWCPTRGTSGTSSARCVLQGRKAGWGREVSAGASRSRGPGRGGLRAHSRCRGVSGHDDVRRPGPGPRAHPPLQGHGLWTVLCTCRGPALLLGHMGTSAPGHRPRPPLPRFPDGPSVNRRERLRSTYCVQGPATSPPGRFPSSPPGPNPAPLTPGPARRGQRPHGAPLRLPAGLRLRGQRLHRRLRQLPELVQLRGPGLRLPERLGAQVQEAGGYVRRRRGGLSGLAPGAGGAGLREAPGSPTPRGRVT